MALGKIHGLSATEYHSTAAVSHSRLEVFRKRPILYYKKYVSGELRRESNHDFDLGTAAHEFVLEGRASYQASTAIWTLGDKRKNKGAWEEFQRVNADKLIITSEDDAAVHNMASAVNCDAEAGLLIGGGEPEITWRVSSKALPVPLQCRTDYFNGRGCELTDGRPYVVDFKTTPSLDDTEFRNFQKSFVEYGYHRQAGFYVALLRDLGVEVRDFFFVAVEKQEPFGVDVYRASDAAVALGLTETLEDLQRLAGCYASGIWPNRPGGIQTIDVPSWHLKNQTTAGLLSS